MKGIEGQPPAFLVGGRTRALPLQCHLPGTPAFVKCCEPELGQAGPALTDGQEACCFSSLSVNDRERCSGAMAPLSTTAEMASVPSNLCLLLTFTWCFQSRAFSSADFRSLSYSGGQTCFQWQLLAL